MPWDSQVDTNVSKKHTFPFFWPRMFVWNVGLYARVQAVLWLRRLVAGHSPRRPGSDNVRFVVGNVAMGQIFSSFCFPCLSLHRGYALSYRMFKKVTQPMAYLESVFAGRLISKGLWPPRSPDLSPPDFFVWGHLKDTVYSNHPHTLQELQTNIQRTVDRTSSGTLQNVFANMIRRVHPCEERNGGHFQHLL
jgi:hypothetical protein